jgi:hypothetical protein
MRRAVGLAGSSLRCQAVICLVCLTRKHIADSREIEVASAFGEESVMTDAMEAVRQDVHEEAPDELMRGKTHDAGAPDAAVVPVGERDFIVIDGEEPRIGDGGFYDKYGGDP